MSSEDDVVAIGRKLDKIMNGQKPESDAVELLEALGKVDMTIDVLTKTQIGKRINEFRKKTEDEKMSKKAKGLIKDWKALIDKKEEKIEKKESNKESSSQKDDTPQSSQDKPVSAAPVQRTSSGFPPKHLLHDDVRSKSAEMLLNALRCGDMPDGTMDPEDIAVRIEEKLFDTHRGTSDKYKSALRSRVFNLRDKKNPALRENILTGSVKAEKFATMTSEEMASNEMKQIREKFSKEGLLDHQMSVNQGTPSDMFKCGKCQGKRCTYTQLQTRSSDEPMTTFVFCSSCGNRWKFC